MMNGMGFGFIFWILIIGIILWGITVFYNAKRRQDKSYNASGREDPIDILKTRYARGEISGEEFEKIKKDIKAK